MQRTGSLPRGLVVIGLAGGIALALCAPPPSFAEDHFYVTGHGNIVRMTESDTELAVFFGETEPEPMAQTAQRIESRGLGVLKGMDGSVGGTVRIMKKADTRTRRRSVMEADPNIVAVRPVFHFDGDRGWVTVSGGLVFKLADPDGLDDLDALLADYALDDAEPVEDLEGVYRALPLDADVSEIDVAEVMAADPRIAWAQPDLIRELHTRQAGVTDTYYDQQWYLNLMSVPQAWQKSEGLDVLLGMFDDACDVDHPDLRGRLIVGWEGGGHDATLSANSTGGRNPRPKLIGDRHGTAVMGLAVASGNTIGIRGVAPLARFTASRGLGEQGIRDSQIASVYTFARQRSVDVHINSWGAAGPNAQVIVEALRNAYTLGRDLDGQGGMAPRGMVVVFASGNEGEENGPDDDYSSTPWVIGVGASTDGATLADEALASFSNHSPYLSVLAPGGGGVGTNQTLVTTDVSDANGYAEAGFNVAGEDISPEGLSVPGIDSAGDYTATFSGTSASAPLAAGVAALIVSRNPLLTASDVRLILQHTADRIGPTGAGYHPSTSRSPQYAYGRVNAAAAVAMAETTLTNGGLTWPERPSKARIFGDEVRWDESVGADEFLVIESEVIPAFRPQDGICYDERQTGCANAPLEPNLGGGRVIMVGCSPGTCTPGRTHTVRFAEPANVKYFAIYARNRIGNYSFGVLIDSNGVALDAGPVLVNPLTQDPSDQGGGDIAPISVSISAVPVAGPSPLTVQFSGNAQSEFPIDDSKTLWVFDVVDPGSATSTRRTTSYTYVVPAGEQETFIARLLMTDTSGNSGNAQVEITVSGEGDTGGSDGGTLRMIVGVPGTPSKDQAQGTSPLSVELYVDAPTALGVVQSIVWDLGDGTTARSITVPHVYRNDTLEDLRYNVTANVTIKTPGDTITTQQVSRLITVFPAVGGSTNGNTNIDGTGAHGEGGAANPLCGATGMTAPAMILVSLMTWKRRR